MRLLLLIGVTGCAQVFGIDNTTGRDADPARVSVQMQKVQIGATVIKGPLDLSMQTATFLEDDGAGGFVKTPGEYQPPDTLSAAIPLGTPGAMFTLPDQPTPLKRLWTMPARNRSGNFAVFEHADPQDPYPTSALTLQITLPSAFVSGERFRIEAIGAWTARNLAEGTETPAPNIGASSFTTTLQYNTFGRMIGNMPARRISNSDVVVVERYVGNLLTGVHQAQSFDQTEGTDNITVAMSALTANLPFNAMVNGPSITQRFSAVRPTVGTPGISWSINAAPGYSVGSSAGVLLLAGGVDPTMNQMIMTMFPNPFESLSWPAIVQMTAVQSRTYTFMGFPVGLAAVMYTVAEPSSAAIAFDMPAGLPINLRANLTPLTTDGMTVALDLTKPVEIDAQLDKPNNTLYQISIYEVAPNAMMTAADKIHVIDGLTTGEAKFRVPPELFVVDHYYFVSFRSMQGGFTNAAMGDMQTLTLPYSVSAADSAVFKVVAP